MVENPHNKYKSKEQLRDEMAAHLVYSVAHSRETIIRMGRYEWRVDSNKAGLRDSLIAQIEFTLDNDLVQNSTAAQVARVKVN